MSLRHPVQRAAHNALYLRHDPSKVQRVHVQRVMSQAQRTMRSCIVAEVMSQVQRRIRSACALAGYLEMPDKLYI